MYFFTRRFNSVDVIAIAARSKYLFTEQWYVGLGIIVGGITISVLGELAFDIR